MARIFHWRFSFAYWAVFGVILSFISFCMYVLICVWLFETPWTVVHWAPLSMEFSGQEYWTWLPFHPAVDPLDPGIKLVSPVSSALVGRFFTTEPPGKPINWMYYTLDKNTMFSIKTFIGIFPHVYLESVFIFMLVMSWV